MPAVIPFLPLIAAGIGVGGGIVSSKISANAAKSAQTQAASIAANDPLAIAQRQQIEQQTQYGKEMAGYSRELFPKYMAGTDYLANYWRSVLEPSNTKALEAISPFVQARKGATQAQLRNLQFAPRGGGMNAGLQDIYSTESRDILNALSGERESARTGYAALTGDIGSRATNLLGSAAGTSANAASLLGTMADRSINAQLQAGELARGRAANTVTNLADSLSPLLYSLIFKQKSGSLPRTPPWAGGGYDYGT